MSGVFRRVRTTIHPNPEIGPVSVEMISDDLLCGAIQFISDVKLRGGHAQSDVKGVRSAYIFRKIKLLGMETLGPQPPCFVEWNPRVIADVPAVVVNPGRPLARKIHLGPKRSAR